MIGGALGRPSKTENHWFVVGIAVDQRKCTMRKLRRLSRKSVAVRAAAVIEFMERRVLFSTATWTDDSVVLKTEMTTPDGYSSPNGAPITPALMRDAYGLGTYNASSVTFNGVQGTGAGQTIAIVEGGSDPDIAADLTAFDSYWGLPAPPSLTQLNATGGTTLPAVGDVGELDLDVEWAHVMAPQASIALYDGNLYTAITTASNAPGVCAISISYTIPGTEGISEFSTPSGHTGVTFLSAAGDTGAEVSDPAKSPAVVAVGGTDLTVHNNAYSSEVGWSASGGGVNTAEAQPTYQNGTVSAFSTTNRVVPDVAMDADPGTGVAVYDEYDNGTTAPWSAIIGGTSLSTPLMAGIVAVADQGRVAAGLTAMDGYTQTLPRLYNLYTANASTNFHDITTGNNGHAAGVGYDEVTGIGSPIANKLIPDLAGADTITGRAYIDTNGNGTYDAGTDTPLAGKTVYLDLGNTGAQTTTDPTAITDANGLYTFSDVIGSFTGKVRLAGAAGYLPENNATLTTAYDTTQTYDLIFSSATTYTATASPITVTAFTSALGVTISGTPASNLSYTWSATTKPFGSAPAFSPNGTAAAINSTVTFNLAGTYVLTVQISDGAGHIATSSVTVTVSQTLSSLTITPVSPNLTGGTTQQMTATAIDQFGTPLANQPATFTWSLTAGNGSINSSTGVYTAPASGTLATVKAVYSTFSATDQIYVVSSPWASADIGSPASSGNAFDTSAVFNISSGGTGVTGTSDQFHYVYRPLGGDGTIIARVATQSNSNASAGAGVMIRASLDPASQEVSMGLTPTGGASFESRTTQGGTTATSTAAGIAAPYWVKLVRSGNTITGYYSSNGTTWVLASSASVIMTGSIYIGLYDTAHSSTSTSTATFDNVALMDAANDAITTSAGSPGSVNVLTNDVGLSGTLTVTSVTQGAKGSVTIGSGGLVTYTTSTLVAGTDSFNYTVTDSAGDSATATVNVTILGMIADYKFDEGSGLTATDSTGNGYTGTINNATFTTGITGLSTDHALLFNGTNSTVSFSNSPSLGGTGNFSLGAWVKTSATTAGDIIEQRDANGYNGEYELTVGSSGKVSFYIYNNGYQFNITTTQAVNDGNWHQITATRNGSIGTIYIDGVQAATGSGTVLSLTSTITVTLGADVRSNDSYFNGTLDNVMIFNNAVTPSTLATISSLLPTVVTAAAATPAPTATTASLSVLGGDYYEGESNLTYTWTATTLPTGATAPAFSANGTNAAKNSVATFHKAGNYVLTVTIADGQGRSATSSVSITVIPTAYTGTTGNDTYAIRLSPSDSTMEQIFVNIPETAAPTYTVPINQLPSLSFTTADDGIVTIDFANGSPLPAGGVSFSGGNILYFEGVSSGNMGFTINGSQVIDTAAATSPISYSNLKIVEFDLVGGSNTLTQLAQPTAAVTYNAGPLSNTLNVSGGTFTFNSNPQTSGGSLTVNDNAAVVFSAPAAGSGYNPRNLFALNIGSTATASLNASTTADRTVLELNQLSITAGGSLDLGNNAMIVHTGNLQTTTNLVNAGRTSAAGITSSSVRADPKSLSSLAAIGAIPGVNSFDGQPVVSTDVLLKDTYVGDTNLDGKVDASDYSRIDSGYLTHATGWSNGDFNGDGVINGSDYTLIDNAFNTQGAIDAAQIAPATAQKNSAKPGRAASQPPRVPGNPFQAQAPIQIPGTTLPDPDTLLLKKDVLDALSS